jgi:hypothetical protein
MKRAVFLALTAALASLFLPSAILAGAMVVPAENPPLPAGGHSVVDVRVAMSPPAAMNADDSRERITQIDKAPFASLIRKIAFVDEPDQECVAHYQKRLRSQLSKEDVFRKYGATGQLKCPYIGPDRKIGSIEGSASYTCSDDVLTTNLHNFVDFHTGALLARPSQCSITIFTPHGKEKRPVKLQSFVGGIDIFKKGMTDAERKDLLKDANSDWAVLKTGTHATDVTPYVVYDTNPIVATNLANINIISVSGPQSGTNCQSVSVYCPILASFPPRKITRPRGLRTSCDFNHGASGGADLQEINGQMVMVAIHGEGNQPNQNEDAVWYKDPAKNKFQAEVNDSMSVLLERNFLDAVKSACGPDHIAHLSPGNPYDGTTDSEPPTIGHK